jgi:cytochrome c oxidase subunit I+III
LATIGSGILAASVLVFVVNVIVSLFRGRLAGDNPWGGTTLEWATPSPPPPFGFAEVPFVESRQPLKRAKEALTYVTGLPMLVRTSLVTRLHDAEPDHISVDPEPSIWPLVSALAVTVLFIGSIFTPWALIWGAVPVTIALIGWFWPTKEETRKMCKIEVKPEEGTPARFVEDEP